MLLADIAVSIQLSKTEHNKAVDRFETMRDWIDRDASPLHGLVRLMYPQGSMAIGATIARVSDREEYDIDVIVDLDISARLARKLSLTPCTKRSGESRVPRYYGKTIRHTRCVCVTYEDGMHIDLTPAVLSPQLTPRISTIFHSKPEDSHVQDHCLWANPWGLADWFKGMTPQEADFARFFRGEVACSSTPAKLLQRRRASQCRSRNQPIVSPGRLSPCSSSAVAERALCEERPSTYAPFALRAPL